MPVISALVIVIVCVTLTLKLFSQSQFSTRLTENQTVQMQQNWAALSAVALARQQLQRDAQHSNIDQLGEPWAKPIDAQPFANLLGSKNAATSFSDTRLSQTIVDQQSRFNLRNLVTRMPGRDVGPNLPAIQAYQKLLSLLNLDPALALRTAMLIVQQTKAANTKGFCCQSDNTGKWRLNTLMDLRQIDGYSTDVLERLRPYIAFLPGWGRINVNTANARVIAALIPNLSLAQAQTLVDNRKTNYFINMEDFSNRLASLQGGSQQPSSVNVNELFDVRSSHFLINTEVRQGRADLRIASELWRISPETSMLLTVQRIP